MIRSVGIICKPIKEMVVTVVPPLIAWLSERNIHVYVDKDAQACIDGNDRGLSREELAEKIDLLIALGGDGTLLSAARALGGHRIPTLPVNLGGLGFLTSVTLDELYPLLDEVLAGKHRTSERMMLEAQVLRNGKTVMKQSALNDAVVNKAALARMVDFDVRVDGDHVGRYRADGLIVATPTGSTAYSLAAGGPIVDPELDSFLITPICPHMLTNRPLVIPQTAHIEIEFTEPEEPVFLTLDGQVGFQLETNDCISIRKSASKVIFIRAPRKTYFEVLRSKLRWGQR